MISEKARDRIIVPSKTHGRTSNRIDSALLADGNCAEVALCVERLASHTRASDHYVPPGTIENVGKVRTHAVLAASPPESLGKVEVEPFPKRNAKRDSPLQRG